MTYDLLVRGGRVVDGSGLPGFIADVGITDGKIVELGRLRDGAKRTIDASGLVVSPGFIDHHTHMDAQVLWDPFATSEPLHGITSIIMGNCGLALAPVRPGGEDALVKSFVRVEAIPRVALEQGVRWGWRSYGDYLDGLEGRVGLNVGGLVGHIAVRHAVLGEEAVERAATPQEIAQMQALVREAVQGGALGMSTNRNERHFREDLKPVASRLADDDELFALGDVLGDLNAGVIQTILGLNRLEHLAWYGNLARRTGRPIIWQTINHAWSEPDLWRKQLEGIAPTFRAGYRAYGLSNAAPITRRFSLKNVQVFDEFPLWKNVMFLPEPVRVQALSDPETRLKLRADMAAPEKTTYHRRWDLVHVVATTKPEHAALAGKSVAEVATMRGQDPLDAFFDLALAENLETMFVTSFTGGDPEAVGQILQSPYTLVGVSDAGAHVQFGADFGYSTLLLGYWVRERGVLSLEQAIHKLTFQVASIYGLEGRGLLRPGYAADVAVFDPEKVRSCAPEWADDYPANTRRLIQRSEGMHYTIVNGRVVYDDGRLSGELAGEVLRGAVYRKAPQPAVA